MAEEKQPTEVPQEQVVPETTTVFPPRSLDRSFGSGTAPKRTWPELVGLAAEEAEKKIKEEMPGARVQVIPPNCFVTMYFNQRRVPSMLPEKLPSHPELADFKFHFQQFAHFTVHEIKTCNTFY